MTDTGDEQQQTHQQQQDVVLALDVGSSSRRCSAYVLNDNDNDTVRALTDCVGVRKCRLVEPNTGRILLDWDTIDDAIDDALQGLRMLQQETATEFRVVALGFSSFCMNLIGVDSKGRPVPEATISYACNTPEVAAEVQTLKE